MFISEKVLFIIVAAGLYAFVSFKTVGWKNPDINEQFYSQYVREFSGAAVNEESDNRLLDLEYKIEEQEPCYLTYTTEETHKIIMDNLDKSSMYGAIQEKLGFNVTRAIEIKNTKYDGETEEAENINSTAKRRTAPVVKKAKTAETGRRYKPVIKK